MRFRGRRGAAALLLVLLLAPESARAFFQGPGHGCECRHHACPVRPAEPAQAAPPACHDTGPPAAPPAAARTVAGTCSCGLPHSPAAPHREVRAVLEATPTGLALPPAGAVTPPPAVQPLSQLPAPEAPPPRSASPRR